MQPSNQPGFLKLLFAVMLATLLHTQVGCVSDNQVISKAADIHHDLEAAVIEDPELRNYLQSIGQRVVDAAHGLDSEDFGPKSHKDGEDTSWMFEDMEFHLVNSKTLNAFTTGGKHMYVYTELMQKCHNEDELAAVVAHEYAHVYARHVKKGTERQYAALGVGAAAATAGAVAGYNADKTQGALTYGALAGGTALAAMSFVNMGFTRDDENEADKYGFWFYCHAGWDPNRFSGFFQTLIDDGHDKTPEMLSDHPKLANRVAATKERASQLPRNASQWRKPPIADEAQFRRLQQRAADVGRKMPKDKSLEAAQLMLAAFPSCVEPDDSPESKKAQDHIRNIAAGAK